jgi:spore coat protein JC
LSFPEKPYHPLYFLRPFAKQLFIVHTVCFDKLLPQYNRFARQLYFATLWRISPASVGTEELAHLEMVATIVHQLTKNLSMEEIEASGFRNYYVDHTVGIWPQAAGGVPFNACEFQSKGDIITDLMEDMAADATLMY